MFEELPPFTPVNFFQLSADCFPIGTPIPIGNLKKYLLPDTGGLTCEETFAQVAIGWHADGLHLLIKSKKPVERVAYPDIEKGDSVEIFIDTRDRKTSGYATRFCHHFFFLPEAVEGRQAGELSRFRTEDTHELCDPEELKVQSFNQKNNYTLQIFLPIQCLHGYDPEQFDRIGFTYRINRPNDPPQHFTVVSEDYQIEQQPSLWGSLRLIK
jgi:hypothetical protein